METSFGLASIKQEGYTYNYETEESHPTTEAEKIEAAKNTSTYMELCVDVHNMSREYIHMLVDDWIDSELKGGRFGYR